MEFEVHPSQELNPYRPRHRQRGTEAESLATESKVGWSKGFQDALEVLDSNNEILLRFLQQPNSLCSHHLCDVQSMPSSSEKRRITILRPFKMVETGNFAGMNGKRDEHAEKLVHMDQGVRWIRNYTQYAPYLSNHKVNASPAQPTRIVVLKPSPARRTFGEPQRNGREVVKEMPSLMSENLVGHRRDESLFSSIFSNGYVGDDSSFDMSENEHERTNLSDSEIMSPPSRRSLIDTNRFDCPYSSVCREAKRRLSQRWARSRMASNGRPVEQRHVTRSSSTLGDMLALNDIKFTSQVNFEGLGAGDLTSCSSTRSIPVSATFHRDLLSIGCPARNTSVPKETTKAESKKSSFKRKVYSLFFSNNKKENKEKLSGHGSADDSPLAARGTPCSLGEFTSQRPLVQPTESKNQRSPVSVFEPSFEEDNDALLDPSVNSKAQYPGRQVLHKTSLINKSPPIGSVARTLSWNDLDADAATRFPLNPSCLSLSNKNEEQDWIHAVKLLLSMAGLNFEVPFDSFIARWHSPKRPMDQTLRDQYANMYDKEYPHGDQAKRRQWRSSQKLIFDSVNAAIVEIAKGWSGAKNMISTTSMELQKVSAVGSLPLLVLDHVRNQMTDWFCCEGQSSTGDYGCSYSQVVHKIASKEVVRRDWVDEIEVYAENIAMEVQGQLLEDTLEEAVVDLMGRHP